MTGYKVVLFDTDIVVRHSPAQI